MEEDSRDIVIELTALLVAATTPAHVSPSGALATLVIGRLGITPLAASLVVTSELVSVVNSAKDTAEGARLPFAPAKHLIGTVDYPTDRAALVPGTVRSWESMLRSHPKIFSPSHSVGSPNQSQRKTFAAIAGGYGTDRTIFTTGKAAAGQVAAALSPLVTDRIRNLTPRTATVRAAIAEAQRIESEAALEAPVRPRWSKRKTMIAFGVAVIVLIGAAFATYNIARGIKNSQLAANYAAMQTASAPFSGGLSAENKSTRAAVVPRNVEASLGDTLSLTLDLINTHAQDFRSLPLVLINNPDELDSSGSGSAPGFYFDIVTSRTTTTTVGTGENAFGGLEDVTEPFSCSTAIVPRPGSATLTTESAGGASNSTKIDADPTLGEYVTRDNFAAVTLKDAIATYTLHEFKSGAHIRLTVPVKLDSNIQESFDLESGTMSVHNTKEASTKIANRDTVTIGKGDTVRADIGLYDGLCSIGSAEVQVWVKSDDHPSEGTMDLTAYASPAGQRDNPRKIGQSTVHYPKGSSLSYVSGSTKAWATSPETCKWQVLNQLPSGILSKGVDIAGIVGYVPRDPCSGTSADSGDRFVTFDLKAT